MVVIDHNSKTDLKRVFEFSTLVRSGKWGAVGGHRGRAGSLRCPRRATPCVAAVERVYKARTQPMGGRDLKAHAASQPGGSNHRPGRASRPVWRARSPVPRLHGPRGMLPECFGAAPVLSRSRSGDDGRAPSYPWLLVAPSPARVQGSATTCTLTGTRAGTCADG